MEKTSWNYKSQVIEEYTRPRELDAAAAAKIVDELRDLLIRIYQEGYGWDKAPMENFFTERHVEQLALDSDHLLIARVDGAPTAFASSILQGETNNAIFVFKAINVFHTVPARESLAVVLGVRMLLRGILNYWELPGKSGGPLPVATRVHNPVVALYFHRFIDRVYPSFKGEPLPGEYRLRYDQLSEYFEEEIDDQGIIHNSPVPLEPLPALYTDGVSLRSAVVRAFAMIDRMDGVVFTGDQAISESLLNFARFAVKDHEPSMAEIEKIAALNKA